MTDVDMLIKMHCNGKYKRSAGFQGNSLSNCHIV